MQINNNWFDSTACKRCRHCNELLTLDINWTQIPIRHRMYDRHINIDRSVTRLSTECENGKKTKKTLREINKQTIYLCTGNWFLFIKRRIDGSGLDLASCICLCGTRRLLLTPPLLPPPPSNTAWLTNDGWFKMQDCDADRCWYVRNWYNTSPHRINSYVCAFVILFAIIFE